MVDGFVDVQKARQKGFRDIRDYVKLYKDLGFSSTDIARMLSVNNLVNVQSKNLKLLDAADKNYFIPYYPDIDNNRVVYRFGTAKPKNKMIEIYNALEGAKIE